MEVLASEIAKEGIQITNSNSILDQDNTILVILVLAYPNLGPILVRVSSILELEVSILVIQCVNLGSKLVILGLTAGYL